MKTVFIAVFFGALLILAIGGVIWLWLDFNDVQLSVHGMIALGLGVGLSLAIGIGLMRLVYWSNRHGYD